MTEKYKCSSLGILVWQIARWSQILSSSPEMLLDTCPYYQKLCFLTRSTHEIFVLPVGRERKRILLLHYLHKMKVLVLLFSVFCPFCVPEYIYIYIYNLASTMQTRTMPLGMGEETWSLNDIVYLSHTALLAFTQACH